MSGVECHHRLWAAHTVERRRAWHAVMALGHHTRSNEVGMLSCLWRVHTIKRRGAWYDITAFGQHTWSNDVGRDMPSPPLDNTQGRTMSGVACYHLFWAAQTVGRRLAWHAITALGQHTRNDDVGRGMTSPLLDSMHCRTASGKA